VTASEHTFHESQPSLSMLLLFGREEEEAEASASREALVNWSAPAFGGGGGGAPSWTEIPGAESRIDSAVARMPRHRILEDAGSSARD
jgi:hypothetical protein